MNKKTPNPRLFDKTEKKDHTRKPVIRDPLPEKDKITLCELVTWLAIGTAWPACRLKDWLKSNRGQRKPVWDSFEREAVTVVSLCGNGDLFPHGSVDGGPHQPFSDGYFLSDVYAEPVSDSIGPDPLAWPSSGPYPDEPDEEPKKLPTYRSVQFLRSDVLSGQADQPAAETDQAPGGGTQDDATPAPEMVSERETDRLKPATSAVPSLDSVILTGAERAAATRTKVETKKKFKDVHQQFLNDHSRPATVIESYKLGGSIGVKRDYARELRRELPPQLKNERRRPSQK